MSSNKKEQTVGRPEPEFKFGIGTVVWIVVGFFVSWVNMLIILNTMQIWSYLTIIFTTIIPGVIIGLKDRYWGYGYMGGFAIAGIPFAFFNPAHGYLFVGGYTFATALFIFIIILLIFWTGWRSISAIKRVEQ
jgi:ABC-type glucose/galactose transport system permease subunit